MQATVRQSAAEIEEALATEDYDEAAALQLDAESAQADVAALVAEHGFQVKELCELSYPACAQASASMVSLCSRFGSSTLQVSPCMG